MSETFRRLCMLAAEGDLTTHSELLRILQRQERGVFLPRGKETGHLDSKRQKIHFGDVILSHSQTEYTIGVVCGKTKSQLKVLNPEFSKEIYGSAPGSGIRSIVERVTVHTRHRLPHMCLVLTPSALEESLYGYVVLEYLERHPLDLDFLGSEHD